MKITSNYYDVLFVDKLIFPDLEDATFGDFVALQIVEEYYVSSSRVDLGVALLCGDVRFAHL